MAINQPVDYRRDTPGESSIVFHVVEMPRLRHHDLRVYENFLVDCLSIGSFRLRISVYSAMLKIRYFIYLPYKY